MGQCFAAAQISAHSCPSSTVFLYVYLISYLFNKYGKIFIISIYLKKNKIIFQIYVKKLYIRVHSPTAAGSATYKLILHKLLRNVVSQRKATKSII